MTGEDTFWVMKFVTRMAELRTLILKGLNDNKIINDFVTFAEEIRSLPHLETIEYDFPRIKCYSEDVAKIIHTGKSVKNFSFSFEYIDVNSGQTPSTYESDADLERLTLKCYFSIGEQIKRWLQRQVFSGCSNLRFLHIHDTGSHNQFWIRYIFEVIYHLGNLEELHIVGKRLGYGSDRRVYLSSHERLKVLSIKQSDKQIYYIDEYEYMGTFLSALVRLQKISITLFTRSLSDAMREIICLKSLEEIEIIHNQFTP